MLPGCPHEIRGNRPLSPEVRRRTKMFRYSWTYRLLAGSWFLGWLVAGGSVSIPANQRESNAFLRWLYRCGDALHQTVQKSSILSHGLGILGTLIIVYGIWRLTVGAGLRIPLLLILAGILLSMLQFIPGAGKGSYILSLFHWWSRTD